MGCGLCKQNGKDAIQPKLKSGSIDDFDHPDAELDLNEGED